MAEKERQNNNQFTDKSFLRAVGTIFFSLFINISKNAGALFGLGLVLYKIDFSEVLVAHAGEETIYDYTLNANVDVGVQEVITEINTALIYYSIGITILVIVLFIWAMLERRLRQNTIEDVGNRNSELEKIVDSNKASSNLTDKGTTNKGDQL